MRRFVIALAAVMLLCVTQCSGRALPRPSAAKLPDQVCNQARHVRRQVDHASVIAQLVPAPSALMAGAETGHYPSPRPSPARGEGAGKLVIVTIGGTSLDDIGGPGLSNISHLIQTGAVGVMNTRPASGLGAPGDAPIMGYSMAGSCATIGAGTRTAVTSDAKQAYSRFESVEDRPAIELYTSRYGRSPGSAEVLHLGMNRLRFVNSEAKYPIQPGALGDALHSHGLKTAIIGNSDTPADQYREASLIAADGNGIIDFGDMSARLLMRDPDAPYGLRADADRLISQFHRVLPKADLIVVDVGDTVRAAKYARHCAEDQGEKLRLDALRSADSIIGKIAASLDLKRDRIMIVSTNAAPLAVEELDYLPPVIAAGRGIDRGLLSSGSTRRSGIITNADISVSVLDFFGLDAPYSFVGRSLIVTKGSILDLTTENRRIILQMERQPVVKGLATFLIVYVLSLSIYVLWFRRDRAGWLGWAALVPVALVLSIIWLPAVANPGLSGAVAGLAGLVAGVIALSWVVLRSPVRAFGWMCGAIVLTALIDLSRGAVLLRDSIMSYTPVDGARYYGIGNEMEGCLIAAAVIGAGFLASACSGSKKLRMPLVTIVPAVVVLFMALPSLGADAGGAISAAAAALIGIILWRGRGISRKHIVFVAGTLLAGVGVMVLFDSLRSDSAQSHVGRAAHLIATSGPGEIWTIIERKLAMNLMLLHYSAWSKLLLVSVAAGVAMLAMERLRVRQTLDRNQDIRSGVMAAVVGAVTTLLLNDSGVVSAATAFIYVWTAIVLAAVHDERGQGLSAQPPLEQTKREGIRIQDSGFRREPSLPDS